ncbi:uncharacterized protein LOC144784978 [Lissotriton helveticus]
MAAPTRTWQPSDERSSERSTTTKSWRLGRQQRQTAETSHLSPRSSRRNFDQEEYLQVVNQASIQDQTGEPTTPNSSRSSPNPVINISNHNLDEEEIKVLSRGLSYVPTAPPNTFLLKTELYRFFRKIRLRYYFRNQTTRQRSSITGLREPSTFFPPTYAMSHKILAFEEIVTFAVDRTLDQRKFVRLNLPKTEKKALMELCNNKELVIKPADKGGAIVIQDLCKYKEEIYRQLSDGVSYQLLSTDPSRELATTILAATQKGLDAGFLSEQEFKFLNQKFPRLATIYTLPKVHKNLESPPGHPIVSGCGSMLEPLCKYVDFFLKPIALNTKAYLRDTT